MQIVGIPPFFIDLPPTDWPFTVNLGLYFFYATAASEAQVCFQDAIATPALVTTRGAVPLLITSAHIRINYIVLHLLQCRTPCHNSRNLPAVIFAQ